MNKEHLKHLQDNNTVQSIWVIELERLYNKCNKLINDLLNEDEVYPDIEKEIKKTEAEISSKLKELFHNK